MGGCSLLAVSRAPLLGGRSLLAAREQHSHKQLAKGSGSEASPSASLTKSMGTEG